MGTNETSRTRWAAVGAAVAISLGAGGVGLSHAAIDSGDRPVFVAITPCRLVDTRPATQIGPRNTPIGPGGTLTQQITGSIGECSGIPTGAAAAALNVTAVQGSTRSFLSIYPANEPLPNASNLNWNGGDPPTPNKVDVDLSPAGAIRITNAFGTVHVAADLVGYYIDHTHDDRYSGRIRTDTYNGFAIQWLSDVPRMGSANACAASPNGGGGVLPLSLPVGATIQAVEASVLDWVGLNLYEISFVKRSLVAGGHAVENLATANGGRSTVSVIDHVLTPATPEVVDATEVFEISFQTGGTSVGNALCSARITYLLPPAG